MKESRPVPIVLLAGALGAGKTTLLRRLLADPRGRRLAVVVNDFGPLAIDAALVADVAGDTIALANGCLCCSARDDLAARLRGLMDEERARFDRLVGTGATERALATELQAVA